MLPHPILIGGQWPRIFIGACITKGSRSWRPTCQRLNVANKRHLYSIYFSMLQFIAELLSSLPDGIPDQTLYRVRGMPFDSLYVFDPQYLLAIGLVIAVEYPSSGTARDLLLNMPPIAPRDRPSHGGSRSPRSIAVSPAPQAVDPLAKPNPAPSGVMFIPHRGV